MTIVDFDVDAVDRAFEPRYLITVMSLLSTLFGWLSKPRLAANPVPRPKQFKIPAEQIVSLIPPGGGCMASDHITVEGQPVGYMYRQAPNYAADSGWTFMSGRESQEYTDDPDNWAIYELNTVANYDRAIIPYLDSPVGTRLDRVPGTAEFQPAPGTENEDFRGGFNA